MFYLKKKILLWLSCETQCIVETSTNFVIYFYMIYHTAHELVVSMFHMMRGSYGSWSFWNIMDFKGVYSRHGKSGDFFFK